MPAQSTSRLTTAAATFSTHMPTPHPQRCEYTSKRCGNTRALKPNGERHRLCDYHRRLANDNQRRWQNRKKQQARAEQSQVSALLELRGGDHTARTDAEPVEIRASQGEDHSARDWSGAETSRQRPQEQSPLVLPRLRHHHVLSRALSLPVTQEPTTLARGFSFGGVPREHGVQHGFVLPSRDTNRPLEYARSVSEPVASYADWGSSHHDRSWDDGLSMRHEYH